MMPFLGQSQLTLHLFFTFSLLFSGCLVFSYEESSGYFSGWSQEDFVSAPNTGDDNIYKDNVNFEKSNADFKEEWDVSDAKDVPKRHRKRHAAQVEIAEDLTEDDITFSDDLVTYEVTAPVSIDPDLDPDPNRSGNGGIGWSEFQDLSHMTISNLCKAQCSAICADSVSNKHFYNSFLTMGIILSWKVGGTIREFQAGRHKNWHISPFFPYVSLIMQHANRGLLKNY